MASKGISAIIRGTSLSKADPFVKMSVAAVLLSLPNCIWECVGLFYPLKLTIGGYMLPNTIWEPEKRGGFRLHPRGLSWGCVTVKKTQKNIDSKWNNLRNLILNTKSFKIDFTQGPYWWNSSTKINSYGILEVK